MRVAFELIGESALLMRANNIKAQDDLRAYIKDPQNKNKLVPGDERTPPWSWMTGIYFDGGEVAFPSRNIMATIRHGATQFQIKGSKTYKEASQSEIYILEEYCQFETESGRRILKAELDAFRDEPFEKHLEEVEKLGFSLFCIRAKIGQSMPVRVRPRFEAGWKVKGILHTTDTSIDLVKLKQFFEYGGGGGLGDWRPSSPHPGPYGRYCTKLKKL